MGIQICLEQNELRKIPPDNNQILNNMNYYHILTERPADVYWKNENEERKKIDREKLRRKSKTHFPYFQQVGGLTINISRLTSYNTYGNTRNKNENEEKTLFSLFIISSIFYI